MRDKLLSYSVLHPKPTHKLVKIHYAPFWCWDKARATLDSLDSPQLELRGSHHLPPYSILCVATRHPHPNGFYSQDSQGGVLKLSHFGLPGLSKLITPGLNLGLGWVLKQSCSSAQDLSNGVSHLIYTHRGRVDSRLLVVGSQIASLTLDLSFDHNLCYRCLNGSCKAIFDIYISRPFQKYQEHLKARCFDLCNRALKLWESRRTPNSHFWECESHPHTCLKVGLRHEWLKDVKEFLRTRQFEGMLLIQHN
jgi:hypothetical protein